MHYAEIIIDHPYARKKDRFTYQVPEGFSLKEGDGVVIPFQKKKIVGLVSKVEVAKPDFPTKEILSILEPSPFLEPWQLELAQWISEYYFCSIYDCIRLFLPKNIFRNPKKARVSKNKKSAQIEDLNHALTFEQKRIVEEIERDTKHALIQGITGSGKTEIYKELIKKCILSGRQALFLVPEIALTPQFLTRLSGAFPEMAVVHSQISEGEKARLWKAIKTGEISLVLGSRSALFSPFKDLGLIVVDEEHEWSYKQDNSPRYHIRELAFKTAELVGAKIVFGSATPSLETRRLAEEDKIKLLKLTQRIQNTPLPEIHLIDMREELKKRNFSPFSEALEQKISSTLAQNEQVILFLNRRGFASSTLCRDCGKVHECDHCLLPYTYHAKNFSTPRLICHHCGRTAPLPDHCPKCKSLRIKQLGIGTEKIETELRKRFPTARIARADKDTMSKKDSFQTLHSNLMNDEIDILIGTQMIGKGWDLPKVSLVGIVLADLGLNIPDFRTPERMFQLLTQVAGRAGRREKQGQVLIQSYNPDLELFEYIKNHDYDRFYEQEIRSRELAGFPPFGKLAKIMILEENEKKAQEKAELIKNSLLDAQHQIFSAPAFLAKVKGKVQWNVLIQGPHPHELLKKLPQSSELRIDIDPLVSI